MGRPEVLMAKKAKRPNIRPSRSDKNARARVPAKPATTPQAAKQVSSRRGSPTNAHPLSVVGVGASAGGLEAVEQLLRSLPNDNGFALVLVQDLAPQHEKIVWGVLVKAAPRPVLRGTPGKPGPSQH